MLIRGALYVAPTVPGPYDLIAGGVYENQIQNMIDPGPKSVQMSFPLGVSHLKSGIRCKYLTFQRHSIHSIIAMSNLCARIPSLSKEWAKSNVIPRASTRVGQLLAYLKLEAEVVFSRVIPRCLTRHSDRT